MSRDPELGTFGRFVETPVVTRAGPAKPFVDKLSTSL
jgi:hypothetical protein